MMTTASTSASKPPPDGITAPEFDHIDVLGPRQEAGLKKGRGRLSPADWKSGPKKVVIDVIAPFGGRRRRRESWEMDRKILINICKFTILTICFFMLSLFYKESSAKYNEDNENILINSVFLNTKNSENLIRKRKEDISIGVFPIIGGANIIGTKKLINDINENINIKISDRSKDLNFVIVIYDDFSAILKHPYLNQAIKFSYNNEIDYKEKYLGHVKSEKNCLIRIVSNYNNDIYFTLAIINPKNGEFSSALCMVRSFLSSLGLVNIASLSPEKTINFSLNSGKGEFQITKELLEVLRVFYQDKIRSGMNKNEFLSVIKNN